MRRQGEKGKLSPREVQVAALVCEGLDNAAIADELGIAEDTVKQYRKALYAGTGSTDVLQFVFWCLQHPEAIGEGEWVTIARHARGCSCGSPHCTAMRQIRVGIKLDPAA